MRLLTQILEKYLIITLIGALDEEAALSVRDGMQQALQAEKQYLLLDFASVAQATPAGLRLLLPFVQQIQLQKKELLFVNLKEEILKMVSSSGFDSLVKVQESLDSAIQYISSAVRSKK